MQRPRIVFMGTPLLAVPSLQACQAVGEVVAVVTQPDRPKDRGRAVQASAVKLAAEADGLRVLQPPRLKGTDFARTLSALRPEVAVVMAYGRLLPPDVLAAPAQGSLNVHASLLPRWRGAAPIQWALAEGDTETGVCLMRMEAGLDTGPRPGRAAGGHSAQGHGRDAGEPPGPPRRPAAPGGVAPLFPRRAPGGASASWRASPWPVC